MMMLSRRILKANHLIYTRSFSSGDGIKGVAKGNDEKGRKKDDKNKDGTWKKKVDEAEDGNWKKKMDARTADIDEEENEKETPSSKKIIEDDYDYDSDDEEMDDYIESIRNKSYKVVTDEGMGYAAIVPTDLTPEMEADQTWPSVYGTSEMFEYMSDFTEPFTEEEKAITLKEFRYQTKYEFHKVRLPKMHNADVPLDHPCYDALALMKLSIENNANFSRDTKKEIFRGILDNVNEYIDNEVEEEEEEEEEE